MTETGCVRLCRMCGHAEAHHGPISGRWSGNQVIPGRLCYWAENQGYSEDLCPCSGFNTEPSMGYLEVLCAKAGGGLAKELNDEA